MRLLGLAEIKSNGDPEAIILITFFVLIQWPSIIGSKTSGSQPHPPTVHLWGLFEIRIF